MGDPKTMFMVRGPDGRMSTIMAFSHRGAAKAYAEKLDDGISADVDVKRRGVIESWQRFRID